MAFSDSYSGFPNFIIPKFDFLLRHLRCRRSNVFKNIYPSSIYDEVVSEPPIYVCKFVDSPGLEHQLVLANEDGVIAFQDTLTNKNYNGVGFQAHENAIFDIAWIKNSNTFISGSGDRTAVLWNMNSSNSLTAVHTYSGHLGSVKAVDHTPENNAVFVTGGRDNTVILWDTRTNSQENCIKKAHKLHGPHEHSNNSRAFDKKFRVTSIKFLNSTTIVSSADSDGFINVWDLRRTHNHNQESRPKCQLHYGGTSSKKGYSCLQLSPCKSRLYASCMDSYVYEYNLLGYDSNPLRKMSGHQNYTFYIKTVLSPDGCYLLSGSSDFNAYIWNVKDYNENALVCLKGHQDEVSAVAWCPVDITKIVTCSDDFTHRIWSIDRCSSPSSDGVLGYAGTAQVLARPAPQHPSSSSSRVKNEECSSCQSSNYVTPKSRKHSLPDTLSRNCKTSLKFFDSPTSPSTPSNCIRTKKRPYTLLDWIQSPSPPTNKGKSLKRKLSTDENSCDDGPSCKSPLNSREALSPIKFINCENLPATPESLSPCSSFGSPPVLRLSKAPILVTRSLQFSPTANLPDYVKTGDSPHLPSRTKRKRKEDWLTQLSHLWQPSDKRKRL